MNQVSLFEGTMPLKITKPIRLIELFAGIGAQAKALENLGVQFEHYRICEFDKYAVKSYNSVHGTAFETSDITQIHASDLAITDTDRYTYILTYSFPCTDLSVAGKQAGMTRGGGTRSGLLWEVERLLKETDELPQILLMENVPQVISDKFISDFADWIAFLDGLGYTSKWDVLNAKDYGIPQNRERCFMLSWLGDYYYDFPRAIPLKLLLKDMLEESVDEKYFLSEEAVKNLQITSKWSGGGTASLNEPDRNSTTNRDSSNPYGEGLQGLWEPDDERSDSPGIVVAASLKPDKAVQDRCRVLSPDGICQGLRATDYKDPPKIITRAGGPLKDLCRTLKAETHDAGVVLYEE